MLLKSEIRVAAIIRTIQAHNGSAYVRKKGHGEAGDIVVIVIDTSSHKKSLYQRVLGHEWTGFKLAKTQLLNPNGFFNVGNEADVCESELERAMRFDPDLWIIDIECNEFNEAWLN